MTDGKFLSKLTNTYRTLLFEQELPVGGGASPAAPPATPPAAPPVGVPPVGMPPAPGGDPLAEVEKAKKGENTVTDSSEAMLTGLLAKAFFIDFVDEAEKLTIDNTKNNLSEENAKDVELEIVKRIKSEDPTVLDVDDNLFQLTQDGARMFINYLEEENKIKDLDIRPGGGLVYMLNLILTVLLRHFELGEKVKIREKLEEIKERTSEGPTLKESKTNVIFNSVFSKYAKI